MTIRAQQSCGNCDAFRPNRAAAPPRAIPRAGPAEGSCRASPPVLMQGARMVPGSQLAAGGPQMEAVLQGAWPPMISSEWCRGWVLDQKDSGNE